MVNLSRVLGSLAILGLFAALIFFQNHPLPHELKFLCWARLEIAMICAPAIFAVIALTIGRHLLYATLLVRNANYFFDLAKVTSLSLTIIAIALASLRIVELYGAERFAGETFNAGEIVSGWPTWKFVVWLVAGLIFPILVASVCYREYFFSGCWDFLIRTGGGLICGILMCSVFLLVLTIIQGTIFEKSVGLLPVEKDFGWKTNLGDSVVRPLLSFIAGLEKGNATGYVNNNGEIHPGHAQMAIAGLVSLLIYLFWYWYSETKSDWMKYRWPTPFYVLLLLLCIGWFLCTLSFWWDPYHIPATVALVVWVILMNVIGKIDARFEIHSQSEVQKRKAKSSPLADERVQGNSLEMALKMAIDEAKISLERANVADKEHADDAGGAQDSDGDSRPTLSEVFSGGNWKFPANKQGQRTLVVVTASGGGIQASAWAAKVLTEIDKTVEKFTESVGIVSCVSGGSVGTLMYLAGRGDRLSGNAQLTEGQRNAVFKKASDSLLEPVAWGVAFPDFVRNVFPPLAPTFQDRGWALESEMWNRMGIERSKESRNRMESLTIRDLVNPVKEGKIPVVFFNSTSVETGQRVLISPVKIKEDKAQMKTTLADTDVDQPIDLLSHCKQMLDEQPLPAMEHLFEVHNDAGRLRTVDILVSTAVRLSASFSYVAPVAKPAFSTPTSYYDLRPDEHFCDGGYADNPGLVTAIKVTKDLLETFRNMPADKRPFDNVMFVRIEPFPPTRRQVKNQTLGILSQAFGPGTAMKNVRVSTQAERGALEMELFVKAEEERNLNGQGFNVKDVVFQFNSGHNENNDGPPLSWTLPPSAMQKIDESWENVGPAKLAEIKIFFD